MDKINFYIGEQRYLDFEVRSTKKETFSIVDAEYIITRKDGSVLDKGSATVHNGNTVRFLFTASEKGLFVAEVDVTIPPEVVTYKGLLNVS
jgi:hypothetical protein